MLDSTGVDLVKVVVCVLCPREVRINTYTPQYGHDGHPMDIGTFLWGAWPQNDLEEDLDCFIEGRLFEVCRDNDRPGRFSVQETHLGGGCAYSYGRPALPQMKSMGFPRDGAFEPDHTIWLCPHCVVLTEGDPEKILAALNVKERMWFRFNWNHNIDYALFVRFWEMFRRVRDLVSRPYQRGRGR